MISHISTPYTSHVLTIKHKYHFLPDTGVPTDAMRPRAASRQEPTQGPGQSRHVKKRKPKSVISKFQRNFKTQDPVGSVSTLSMHENHPPQPTFQAAAKGFPLTCDPKKPTSFETHMDVIWRFHTWGYPQII